MCRAFWIWHHWCTCLCLKNNLIHLKLNMGFEICVWCFPVFAAGVAGTNLYPYFMLARNWYVDSCFHFGAMMSPCSLFFCPILWRNWPFLVFYLGSSWHICLVIIAISFSFSQPANLINLNPLALLSISTVKPVLPINIGKRDGDVGLVFVEKDQS